MNAAFRIHDRFHIVHDAGGCFPFRIHGFNLIHGFAFCVFGLDGGNDHRVSPQFGQRAVGQIFYFLWRFFGTRPSAGENEKK